MGCDWTSVQVPKTGIDSILDILSETVNLNQNDTIYSFEIASVKIYFYTKSDHHFDFDPKDINSIDEWTIFLDFFKTISKKLNTEILFRPEDSDYKSNDSILVRISGNEVFYNFEIKANYDNE